MNMIVSFALKKDISCVAILVEGKMEVCSVKKEKLSDSRYQDIISVFSRSLRELRQYLNVNERKFEVCFETSNSVVAGWFMKRECKKGYEEVFDEAMETLQEIPIYYTFSCNANTKAVKYCEEKYIKKEALSGLEI